MVSRNARDLAFDDDAYRAQLVRLEAGTLAPEAIADLADAGRYRLETQYTGDFERDVERCSDVFSDYTWWAHELRTARKHGEQIAAAARALAGQLHRSGRSEAFRLLDPGIWEDCPADFAGPNITLQSYLLKLADYFSDLHRCERNLKPHLVPDRFRPGHLRGAVIRDIDKRLMAAWEVRQRQAPGFHPEDGAKRPDGMYPRIAMVASILLAESITTKQVDNALNQ